MSPLDSLLAKDSIRDLVARYGMAVDDRDVQAIADCFSVRGAFRYADGTLALEGRDAVVGYYSERLQALGASYHYPHSHLITVDSPERASGVVNAHAELGFPTGETYWVALRYYDQYVMEDARWRFLERNVAFYYYLPLADLPSALASPYRKRMMTPAREADLPEQLETWKRFKEPI